MLCSSHCILSFESLLLATRNLFNSVSSTFLLCFVTPSDGREQTLVSWYIVFYVLALERPIHFSYSTETNEFDIFPDPNPYLEIYSWDWFEDASSDNVWDNVSVSGSATVDCCLRSVVNNSMILFNAVALNVTKSSNFSNGDDQTIKCIYMNWKTYLLHHLKMSKLQSTIDSNNIKFDNIQSIQFKPSGNFQIWKYKFMTLAETLNVDEQFDASCKDSEK